MARRPDTPCALCGVLRFVSRSSRPAGEMVCNACRRAFPLLGPFRVYRQSSCVDCGSVPCVRGQRRCRACLPPKGYIRRRCSGCDFELMVPRPNSYHRRKPWLCLECRDRRAVRPKPSGESVVPWAACVFCRSWFVARRGRRRCPRTECRWSIEVRRNPALVPAGTPKTVGCGRCGVSVTVLAGPGSGNPRCDTCRLEARRAARRTRKAKRRGVMRVAYEPRTVFERDGWRCGLCGKPVCRSAQVPHPLAPTIDHIVPVARGGHDVPENVQCAHFECNWRKGDRGGNEQLLLLG